MTAHRLRLYAACCRGGAHGGGRTARLTRPALFWATGHVMKPMHGDCLVIWNLPWRILAVMDWLSESEAAHHCAIVLPPPTWIGPSVEDAYVYDAWPRWSRFMPWDDYEREMASWASSWQYKTGRPRMRCKLWRYPALRTEEVQRLHAAAQALLDIRYGMVANWAVGTARINCGEFAARATVASSLTARDDYLDKAKRPKRLDSVTPWEQELAYRRKGAEHKYDYDGRSWYPANTIT